MLWQNLPSIRGQMHKKLTPICVLQWQDPKMDKCRKKQGKRRHKLAVNKDKWISFKTTLLDWLLKKVHKISWVKSWQWQLKVDLESLHKLKFYLSVLLLMIKMSQSVHEKLDSYCRKCLWYIFKLNCDFFFLTRFNSIAKRTEASFRCSLALCTY